MTSSAKSGAVFSGRVDDDRFGQVLEYGAHGFELGFVAEFAEEVAERGGAKDDGRCHVSRCCRMVHDCILILPVIKLDHLMPVHHRHGEVNSAVDVVLKSSAIAGWREFDASYRLVGTDGNRNIIDGNHVFDNVDLLAAADGNVVQQVQHQAVLRRLFVEHNFKGAGSSMFDQGLRQQQVQRVEEERAAPLGRIVVILRKDGAGESDDPPSPHDGCAGGFT